MSIDKKIIIRGIISVLIPIILTYFVYVFTSSYFKVEEYTGFKKDFITGISFVFGLFISATIFSFVSLIKIKNNIDNFLNKKFKQDVLSSVTESVISKVNADKTILKLQTDELEGLSYINSIINLHKSVNDKVIKASIPFVFEILKNGTNKLGEFFDYNSKGGIYSITEAENLYRKLLFEAKSFFVIEPQFIDNYFDFYSPGYKEFISNCGNSKISKSYIYTDEKPDSIESNKTIKWLSDVGFDIMFIDREQARKAINAKWIDYSHLIFDYNDFQISCSVLPILRPEEIKRDITKYLSENNDTNKVDLLEKINKYNINQNFNDANLVYLSFWVGQKRDGSSDNSFIRGLLNIFKSSK